MIKANELRLNNWVLAEGNPYKIKHISPDDEWEPIPLTSEILEKAGFEKGIVKISNVTGDEDCYWYQNHYFVLIRPEQNTFVGKNIVDLEDKIRPAWFSIVFNLHQFQNVFYYLTGEELEINLK